MSNNEMNDQLVKDLEQEREDLVALMEKSIDGSLLEELARVYGGGDTTVASEKDLVATEGTHYAGAY